MFGGALTAERGNWGGGARGSGGSDQQISRGMSSVNEHMAPPAKPRMSPLEFRNTDLVSRLLAATPPYLYNMSLLPNTYFFSEMLRSFVQAKAERNSAALHPANETVQKENLTEEKQDNSADWMLKSNRKSEETPLELTMSKPELPESAYQNKPDHLNQKFDAASDQMFPNLHPSISQDGNSSNLVLPPPPPMWYPRSTPLTPTESTHNASPSESFVPSSSKEKQPHGERIEVKNETDTLNSMFKQHRHCSAFSVPVPSSSKSPTNSSEKESREIGENKRDNCDAEENKNETDEEKKKRVKDLRALIGLELVVDYMNQKPGRQADSLSSTDVESVGSPALEVVAVNDEN
ncbi:hypothetical protein NQ318_022837 [Aromia moschata]|uniref:Uncharacterized protein n=1 Tax=Aromia moschata TaxID=1265417 RepID=A0AAV8XWB6_9CUCU|nr:hypothetical protein NQ318_022837 [Aromia moschata]